jgi:hypothetical protein
MAFLLLGCSSWFPDFVEQRRFERGERIDSIAIVPFTASSRLIANASPDGLPPQEAAAQVTAFVTDALLSRVPLVRATDVAVAWEAKEPGALGEVPEMAAMFAASEFGADAVLLGEVRRYRERVGSAVGSQYPASVEFVVNLYAAPSGTRLWFARFAHTQAALSESVFDTARLPGRGSRFLTVEELARFGAEEVAKELPLGR